MTSRGVYSKMVVAACKISTNGPIVQLVRTLACHARGQGSDPPSGRQYASVAQSVEQGTENPRVGGSIPPGGTTISGCSSSGRAPPCQGGGSGSESRHPLHLISQWVALCSFCRKAAVLTRSAIAPFLRSGGFRGGSLIRRHSQAVRQRSAKPLFPGPIPGGASTFWFSTLVWLSW